MVDDNLDARKFSADDLRDLFEPNFETRSTCHDSLGCDCAVTSLRALARRACRVVRIQALPYISFIPRLLTQASRSRTRTATHICCLPANRYAPWTRTSPGFSNPLVLGAAVLCARSCTPYVLHAGASLPSRSRSSRSRLLPQDRPWRRHELK